MPKKITVLITYDMKGLNGINVGDMTLNINPIRDKGVEEWFKPFKGRVKWDGLISEIFELLQDDEADLDYKFWGPDEDKAIFFECLKNNGIFFETSSQHEFNHEHKEDIVERENNSKELDANKQPSIEETLNKARRNENLGNIDEAIQLYLSLAQKGNAEGQFKYAELKEKLLNENNATNSDHERYIVFRYYEKSAKQEHAKAMIRLGDCYLYGHGVDENITEAKKWYENASQYQQPEAMRKLGHLLYYYEECQDEPAAIEWLEKAAMMEDEKAAFELGFILYYFSDYYDYDKAIKWLKIAANKGNSDAQSRLGKILKGEEAVYWLKKAYAQGEYYYGRYLAQHYLDGDGVEKNEIEAFSILNDCVNHDVIDAYYNLGICYYYGRGTEINYSKAFSCFEKGVLKSLDRMKENGNSYSTFDGLEFYMLGYCYYFGKGVDENNKKAIEYFEKAAEYHNKEALFLLGECYSKGYGVNIDYRKAFNYYHEAALNEHIDSQVILGKCYMNGELDVSINESEAISWYEKAAEKGSASAQEYLAYFYLSGVCVEKDEKLGIELLLKSAKQNNPSAMESLSECYHDGIGVEKNNSMAFEWCEKAAELGDVSAQYNLGIFYSEGTDVPKDIHKAVYWYEKASEQNHTNALINLAWLYITGEYTECNIERVSDWIKKAGDNYRKKDESGDNIYKVARLYDLLLTPKDVRDRIIKEQSNRFKRGFLGAAISVAGLFISTPLAVVGLALEWSGVFGGKKEEKKHYSDILKTNRGKEMLDLYQEAADKGSKEAQDCLKNLKKYLN
ncbi:tetratricopeptide repeat protein [Oribacterium sp. FC2011]|uniref:tetratricopeptide repeat protein n=1 Tax=Oribacterium sp. FC2011 TaxID=1408311 RepID=UPI0004E261FC|nr:SEL1-like repeat protein [Oribacterium sp. FC2011]